MVSWKLLNGVSTVQTFSAFFTNIKEYFMAVPVAYSIAGSCGGALLRRSGDSTPNVLGTL